MVILQRVLYKVRRDRASAILIVPRWHFRPWYLTILEMLTEIPAVLPDNGNLQFKISHPNPQMIKLVAWVAQTSGMEDKWEFLRQRGFQESAIDMILAARAGSTVSCYETRCRTFVGWCTGWGEDPLETTVTDIHVAIFSQEIFENGCAWSTVRGYVAAMTAFYHHFHESSLGSDKNVKDFIEGAIDLDHW